MLLIVLQAIGINQTKVYAKNKNDVRALKNIIQVQRKRGAKVSKNINDTNEYRWKKGRLIYLNWSGNKVKGKLRLNKLTRLESIELNDNQVTNLYVSKCRRLNYLDCSENKLKKLNVSKLKILKELDCHKNKIKKLSLNNKSLVRLN